MSYSPYFSAISRNAMPVSYVNSSLYAESATVEISDSKVVIKNNSFFSEELQGGNEIACINVA
jgi:hypothetical protein